MNEFAESRRHDLILDVKIENEEIYGNVEDGERWKFGKLKMKTKVEKSIRKY